MTKIQEIQFESLVSLGKKLANTFPGTEAEIFPKLGKLKLKVSNEQVLSKFLNTDANNLDSFVDYFEVDLASTTENVNKIKNLIKDYFPHKETYNMHGLIDSINIIAVADREFNATAKSDMIITINHGLALNIDLVVLASIILSDFDNATWSKNKDEAPEILNSIAYLIHSVVTENWEGIFLKPSHIALLKKAANTLKENALPDLDLRIRTKTMRLLFYIIAHECGHLLMFHNSNLLHHDKLPAWADRTFTREYEADLFASASLINLCEQHNQNKLGIGIELALSMGLLALPNSEKLGNNPRPEFKDYRGHPNAFMRSTMIMEHFVPNWTKSEYSKIIYQNLWAISFLQSSCEEILLKK